MSGLKHTWECRSCGSLHATLTAPPKPRYCRKCSKEERRKLRAKIRTLQAERDALTEAVALAAHEAHTMGRVFAVQFGDAGITRAEIDRVSKMAEWQAKKAKGAQR